MNFAQLVTVLTTLKETGQGFQDLPAGFWDQALFSADFHRSLVKFHWTAAQHVQYCLDKDLCANMLHQDVRARGLIPDHLRHAVLSQVYAQPSDFSVELINTYPADLSYIPEKSLAKTLSKCFVKEGYNVVNIMQALPAHRRSYSICLNAIKYCRYQVWTVMQLVPEQHRTRELCRAFFRAEADGSYLEDLPLDLHTENMIYELAVAGQAYLDQVPEHLRDQALYEAVNFECLEDIPERNRSATLCERAVLLDGENLIHVPRIHLTPEIVFSAVSEHGTALMFVPEEMLNEKLFLAALRANPLSAAWVSSEIYGTADFNTASSQLAGKLALIPPERLTDDFLLAIMEAQGTLLSEVPIERQTLSICEAAFRSPHPPNLLNFPIERRSRNFFVSLVRKSWRGLRHVMADYLYDLQEPCICEEAIRNHPCALRYVPADHNRFLELTTIANEVAAIREIDMGLC